MKVEWVGGVLCFLAVALVGSECLAVDQYQAGSLGEKLTVPMIEAEKTKKKMAAIPPPTAENFPVLDPEKLPEKLDEMAKIPSPAGEPAPPSFRKQRPEDAAEMAVIP